MLLEYFEYIANKSNKSKIEKLYLKEIIATKYNFKKNSNLWKTHLVNTKKTIIEFCKDKNGTCVILGSGNLLDIPVEYLVNKFDKVFLLDYLHLKRTKKKYKFKNLFYVELDLVNIPKQKIFDSLNINSIDALISVNILSQLPLLNLSQKSLNNSEYEKSYTNIILSHIKLLESFSNASLLITEIAREINITKIELFELNNNWKEIASWKWNFSKRKQTNYVKAYKL